MKRITLLGLLGLVALSCIKEQQETISVFTDNPVFYAAFGDDAEPATKAYADEQLRGRWDAGDHISIFNKNTINREYAFQGQTGDNSGTFKKVPSDDFYAGNPLSYVYAVYPYSESTSISDDGEITLTLPAEQSYRENTYGLAANTMIAVTEDDELMFKNLCGYFAVKLYGDNVTVKSISIKGNNNELLAGKATVVAAIDDYPALTFETATAKKEITLTLDTPVTIGSTAENATAFIFVVPPTSFEKGIKLTVRDSQDNTFSKTTTTPVEIKRNKLKKSAPLEVVVLQPDNIIYYTSQDGKIVSPSVQDAFNVNIVTNEYKDGQGTITLDGDVKNIRHNAFKDCETLTGISLPGSVMSLGSSAFENCIRLAEVNIPDGIATIGRRAFLNCSSLVSIKIPNSVKTIDIGAFHFCSSLTSITIPSSVTSIENLVFYGCSSLTEITIPESVTTLGVGVFANCPSLLSFTGKFASPDGLYLIDSGTLMAAAMGSINGAIVIPDSVSGIGDYAFLGSPRMTGVTIHDGVTHIGECAFVECPSIMSFSGKFASQDGLYLIDSGTVVAAALGAIGANATILNDVTALGDEVFYGYHQLVGITIPEGLQRIGNFVFTGCDGLKTITFPSSVTEIGSYACADCPSLTRVFSLPETPPLCSNNAFDNTNNCPIYVPSSSVDAYKSGDYFWSDYADRIQPLAPLPEAVDLGLSVKWASFNLGATAPEEYGDYYAWGDTEPYYSSLDPLIWKDGKKDGYWWSSYKWCMGSETTMTKYCSDSSHGNNGFTDTKTVLDPEDDAAHVNLGGSWRVSTDAEWTELRKNCTWTWTTQNGVNGRLVTGSNGNSIFLPAAGYRYDDFLGFVGSIGFYWSSSLSAGNPDRAWLVNFDSGDVCRSQSDRCNGFSVRPVCPKN